MTQERADEELSARVRELEAAVSERDQVISSLTSEVEKYHLLINNTSDLILSVVPDGSFLFVNEAWKKKLGYSSDDIKNLKLMDTVDPDLLGNCSLIFQNLLAGDELDQFNSVFVGKDGKKVFVEGSCRATFPEGGSAVMIGVFRDVSGREARERALKESEERYRDLFENATDLIQLVEPDGRLSYVNRSWKRTFGYSEDDIKNGLSIFDLISPDCSEHCRNVFARVVSFPGVQNVESTFISKEGRKVIIQGNAKCKFVDGKAVQTQCIFRDVTEEKKMEGELVKNQKIESLGVLAGGIAHDFNNLLTAILGNISLAKRYAEQGSKVFGFLNNSERASARAKGLTQQLLTFSKGGAPIKKTTTITELIIDSTNFILRGSNVGCEYDFDSNLWAVDADEGQISQVVQNLVINASQVMPDGGEITITGRNLTLKDGNVANLPEGNYVQLSFRDQGHGIPEEIISKIFDPYFTSKPTGSGLGLAVAYSIIRYHEGVIQASSEPGKGTVFTVYLPASSQESIRIDLEKSIDSLCCGKKILVMDNEDLIRQIAADMLEFLGCEVSLAGNGQEAIDLYLDQRERGESFDAVILDLTVPGKMGGLEALGKLSLIDPDVKVLVASGYANNPVMANYKEYGFSGVIPKPFKVEELSSALADVLKRK